MVWVGFEILVRSYGLGLSQRRAEWHVKWTSQVAAAKTIRTAFVRRSAWSHHVRSGCTRTWATVLETTIQVSHTTYIPEMQSDVSRLMWYSFYAT